MGFTRLGMIIKKHLAKGVTIRDMDILFTMQSGLWAGGVLDIFRYRT